MVSFNKPPLEFFEDDLSEASEKTLVTLVSATHRIIDLAAKSISSHENISYDDAMKHVTNTVLYVTIDQVFRVFGTKPSPDLLQDCIRKVITHIDGLDAAP